jgi:hypothetical protein
VKISDFRREVLSLRVSANTAPQPQPGEEIDRLIRADTWPLANNEFDAMKARDAGMSKSARSLAGEDG